MSNNTNLQNFPNKDNTTLNFNELRVHMASNEIIFEDEFDITSDSFKRFKGKSYRYGKDEFYRIRKIDFLNQIHFSVIYGSWHGGLRQIYNYYSLSEEKLSPEQIKLFNALKKKTEFENNVRIKREERARQERAQEIWEEASTEPFHETHLVYFVRKKVKPLDVRYITTPEGYHPVIVPIRNLKGQITGIQKIYAEGYKEINGLKTGNFHIIGPFGCSLYAYVVEGYATGLSVYEATKKPVIVAFDCGNLPKVVEEFKTTYKNIELIIAADDDIGTELEKGFNPGVEAALQTGCEYKTPKFKNVKDENDKYYTDFNDLLQVEGIQEVRRQLKLKVNFDISKPFDDFVKEQLVARPTIIGDWLTPWSSVLVWSETGIGKTFFCLTLGLSLATASDFLSYKYFGKKEGYKILYISGEVCKQDLQRRILALALGFGKDVASENFRICSMRDDFPLFFKYLSQSKVEKIALMAEDTDFVILDNLNSLFPHGDENELENWNSIQNLLYAFGAQKKGVIIVHHSTKSGLTQSGTGRKETEVENVIALKRPYPYGKQDGIYLNVLFSKHRDFIPKPGKQLDICCHMIDDKERIYWESSNINESYKRSIRSALSINIKTPMSICSTTGISEATVGKLLKECV